MLFRSDEFEKGTWDFVEEDGTQPSHREYRKMPLSDHSEFHPFSDFNDLSTFRETNVAYYGHRIEYKSELTPDQYFENK